MVTEPVLRFLILRWRMARQFPGVFRSRPTTACSSPSSATMTMPLRTCIASTDAMTFLFIKRETASRSGAVTLPQFVFGRFCLFLRRVHQGGELLVRQEETLEEAKPIAHRQPAP